MAFIDTRHFRPVAMATTHISPILAIPVRHRAGWRRADAPRGGVLSHWSGVRRLT